FVSSSSNLTVGDSNRERDAFVRDIGAGTTERVSVPRGGGQPNGPTYSVTLSGDGRFVAFSSDASNLVTRDRNGARDVFVLDRTTERIEVASVASDDRAGNADSGGPSISNDGRFVAFPSIASSL